MDHQVFAAKLGRPATGPDHGVEYRSGEVQSRSRISEFPVPGGGKFDRAVRTLDRIVTSVPASLHGRENRGQQRRLVATHRTRSHTPTLIVLNQSFLLGGLPEKLLRPLPDLLELREIGLIDEILEFFQINHRRSRVLQRVPQ